MRGVVLAVLVALPASSISASVLLPAVQALALTGLLSDARAAIDYAYARGVIVAAAGNDFASICGEPGFNAHAICVVATDRHRPDARNLHARHVHANVRVRDRGRSGCVSAP